MATDERPHVASEPLANEVRTGGNGHGRPVERATVVSPTVSGFGVAPVTSSRPAPAVPLVPPTRPAPRPLAPTPIARTGTRSPLFVDPDLEVDSPTTTTPAPAPARARPPVWTRMARRPRVRKVNRIVRRIDAWSVFKIALVFWAVSLVILLVAGLLLWNLAESTGTLTNIEGFAKELFGLETFEFNGNEIFRASWVIGAVLVVALTATSVTLAVLFNLISDLLGGVRVTVLEEEVVLRRPSASAPAPAPEAQPEAAASNGG